jgi:hypothetical protein
MEPENTLRYKTRKESGSKTNDLKADDFERVFKLA